MASSKSCGKENAASLLESQRSVASICLQTTFSICTEKHLERVLHHRERKSFSHLNFFCFKILAPAKHFSGASVEIPDIAWFLTGISDGIHIENLHRLAKVKLSEVSILISPVVVVKPIGQIGTLLNLCKKNSLSNRMNRSGLDEKHIAFMNRHIVKIILQSSVCDILL